MNLFKLKKNGTTIGYMRLSGAFANYKLSLKDEKWLFQRDFENLPEINTSVVSFEALPYVCNDKNGEKLFAGDKVLLWGAQKGRIEKLDTILLRYGIRFWDE